VLSKPSSWIWRGEPRTRNGYKGKGGKWKEVRGRREEKGQVTILAFFRTSSHANVRYTKFTNMEVYSGQDIALSVSDTVEG